ncbi:hypothetical protein MHYP_G00352940 [Metynnis hypsauchen]
MTDTDASPAASCVEKLKTYVRTRKGTILAVEILLSLIIIICYAASLYGGYTAVAICEMTFAIIVFVFLMMDLNKHFQLISWLWSDLFRTVTGSLLYIITSLICVIGGAGDGARIAGGVFGLCAGILFGYDAYMVFLEIKNITGHTATSTDDRV